MSRKIFMLTAGALGLFAAFSAPALAENFRSLTKSNPVAKEVWSSSGSNVRHKPSGAECALDQGTASLVFIKTLQDDTDKITKTGCRYELASGASWYLEIEPATSRRIDDILVEFGTAARAEVGGMVGVAPGPIATPAATKQALIVPYSLAILSETSRKRSAMWFGDVSGWRITVTARLYDDSARREIEQQAADAWALAAAGAAKANKPPKTK